MKLRGVLLIAVMVSMASFPAMSAERAWWKKIYVGADAQMRRMDFKGGFGDNLLYHESPQGNLYAGLKFSEYFGVELGYEATATRTRTSALTTGDISAGIPVVSAMSPSIYKTKAKIKGPHAELVGFYSPNDNYPVQLLASVGVSILKGTFERRTLQMGAFHSSIIRTLSQHKSVLRLMGGVQCMFTDHLGIRATIGWVNTAKMVIYANDGLPNTPELKPKNSTVYGLGVLLAF